MISIPLESKEKKVTQDQGIELCRKLYERLKPDGFYVALTGGLLYKDGERKDIDIIIYRNRQQVKFEIKDIESKLDECCLYDFEHYGFVTKCKFKGITVDLFNPETDIEFTDGNSY